MFLKSKGQHEDATSPIKRRMPNLGLENAVARGIGLPGTDSMTEIAYYIVA